MATVIAPVAGWTGTVGNTEFVDGVGHTDVPKALRYFQRAGFTIEPDEPTPAPKAPAKGKSTREATPAAQAPAQPDSGIELATVPVQAEMAPVDRPSPSANKAAWFEYLDQVAPGHGLTVENATKADMIRAVENAEA